MSTLTVRTPGGQNLNICDSDWHVRNDENTAWVRIDPLNDVRVRHGSNEYWLPITCDGDNELCPPEDIVECWPGYDGIFDSAEFKTGGETGYLICKCDGTECKTYTGHTPDFSVKGGRFFSTAPIFEGAQAPALPTTFFGSEAQVTEMLVKAGNRSGNIDVSVHSLDPGARVRIYHNCTLLGDTNVSGNYFNVFFNAEPPELREEDCGVQREVNNFITVRVDAPAGARWRVRLGEVNTVVSSSYQRPAPCFGTFAPNLPCFVNDDERVIPGVARYEMIHEIPTSGTMRIDTNIRGEDPVVLSVFYNGGLIATTTTTNTPANPSALATLAFTLNQVGGDNFIVVRYEAPRQYNDWTYSIYCPNQRGSRNFMMPCTPVPSVIPYEVLCTPLLTSLPPEWTVTGGGAPYSDVYYDFSGKSAGDIVVEFFAEDSVQIFFYQGKYPSEVLVGATEGFVSGHDRFYFDFNPAFGTVLHARIVGPCCPNWSFMISCPVPKPIINIYDAEIVRGGLGQVSYLCFTVDLANKTPRDVTFDFVTTPITAMESTDGTCTITETVPDSPFCNITATGSGVEAGSSNDTNIGYPCSRIRSSLHSPNCAVGGQYYVVETEIELPYSGTYTMVGCADDNMVVYLDCVAKMSAPSWEWAARATITAEAGWQTLSIMYQNVPNCTPGWAKLVILNNAGQIVFATNPNTHTWRSKAGGITVEPPPLPITYGADYNRSSGSGVIPACTKTTQICIPVCGTDLMGPDVTFALTLSNVKNAVIGDLVAVGTIKNPNHYECDQNTQIAVLDGGPDQYVNRGARKMFVNKLASNPGAAYVMDADITLQTSGLHTFYFFGADTCELYVDCRLIARLNNPSFASKVRLPMNMGARKMHIIYYTNGGNARRSGYAAMCIVDNLNRVVYASNAAHWRGRIINAGTEPTCNQFAGSCLISGNSIQQQVHSGGSGSFTVGYGSVKVRTSLHGNGSQPNGINYSLQYSPNLPAGTYTVKWSCDDAGSFYVNCVLVRNKTSNWRTVDTFTFVHPGGAVPITVIYRNTGGNVAWTNWAILNSAGQAVSVSGTNLPGQASAIGDVVAATMGERLGETYQGRYGIWTVHRGGSIYGTGLHYAWWSAEKDFVIPEDGTYYATGTADDAMNLYIDCVGRPLNGTPFYLDAGPTKMHVRVYNLKQKNENWFHFKLFKANGTLVYESRADGWKGKPRDLDFSGLS